MFLMRHRLPDLLFGLLAQAVASTAFSLGACYNTVQQELAQNPALGLNPAFFVFTPADPSDPYLTLAGCAALCGGDDNAIYPDCGARILQWVFPVVILVGSIQTPPSAWWKRFWVMLRVLGDPFDALLSMAYVLRTYEHCYDRAAGPAEELADGVRDQMRVLMRALSNGSGRGAPLSLVQALDVGSKRERRLQICFAVIMHAIVDLCPSLTIDNVQMCMRDIVASTTFPLPLSSSPGFEPRDLEVLVRKTAGRIMNDRCRPLWKAYGAICSCLVGFIVALIPQAVGSVASGGMLAAILMLSPLFLDVPLSNSIDEYNSSHELVDTIREFLDIPPLLRHRESGGRRLGSAAELAGLRALIAEKEFGSEGFAEQFSRNAQTSLYQPRKFTRRRVPLGLREYCIAGALGMLFPLCVTWAGVALAAAPAYFNDHHWVLIGIFFSWVLSFCITLVLARLGERYDIARETPGIIRRAQRLWHLVIVKDIAFAALTPVLLAGITCGWLSTCRSWAGISRYGEDGARVRLNPKDDFAYNGYRLYPAVVSSCLGLNMLIYLLLRRVFWKSYAVLMWKDEEIRKAMSGD